LIQQDWDNFASILAAKIQGTRILDALTRELPLDHFVLFSSSASLMGNLGQANHAAANAYLDATAELRRNQGLAGLSINWGAWSEVGAVVDGAYATQMQAVGVRPIPTAAGLAALGRAMTNEQSHIGIVPVNWSEFLAGYDGHIPPFFSRLATDTSKATSNTAQTSKAPVADLKALLGKVAPEQRLESLRSFIQTQAATVLGITETTAIDVQQPLSELGLDSLLALELRTRLGDAVGEKQPATLLFNHPSIEALTDYLAAKFVDLPATEFSDEDALMAEIAELSEEDLASLIDDELTKL
jgi:acyl carrier protein